MSLANNSPVVTNAVEARPDEVIRVDHVYKQYRQATYNLSLRHEADIALKRILGRYVQHKPAPPFYALQDVTFSVHKGEAVGIVGRNGAGKTTLLRVLAGVTKPTTGTVQVNGRFATLIGLNAGFNYDMSGRKNIYLNAAIFGTHPRETAALEQQIVDFADIGDFIDLPVKVYSSGMQARLGFSIAIHIMPEIIFLDEVLAVGDQAFVQKCTERILRFKAENRTLVVVSHALSWIEKLCQRVIWLEKGVVRMDGPLKEVIECYQQAI